jgi:cytochrome P450/NADPH-cytochrome P450 reductase
VLLRLTLDLSLYVTNYATYYAATHLPMNEPVPLLGILANRVELQDVATRAQRAALATYAQDATERQPLLALGGDSEAGEAHYHEQVLNS